MIRAFEAVAPAFLRSNSRWLPTPAAKSILLAGPSRCNDLGSAFTLAPVHSGLTRETPAGGGVASCVNTGQVKTRGALRSGPTSRLGNHPRASRAAIRSGGGWVTSQAPSRMGESEGVVRRASISSALVVSVATEEANHG